MGRVCHFCSAIACRLSKWRFSYSNELAFLRASNACSTTRKNCRITYGWQRTVSHAMPAFDCSYDQQHILSLHRILHLCAAKITRRSITAKNKNDSSCIPFLKFRSLLIRKRTHSSRTLYQLQLCHLKPNCDSLLHSHSKAPFEKTTSQPTESNKNTHPIPSHPVRQADFFSNFNTLSHNLLLPISYTNATLSLSFSRLKITTFIE